MKYNPILIILFLLISTTSWAAGKKETPHYDVVNEYIRSLGTIRNLQKVARKDIEVDTKADDPVTARLMSGIRNSTRVKLELNYSIQILKGMKLNKPFDTLLPTTIEFYKNKIELYDELIKIATNLLSGPKPGVDYGKMAAIMPHITAQVEYIDESIFQLMPLVFALLIDMKPDSEGHMGHLNISTAQKQKLIDSINGYFGESLHAKDKHWTVSSAAVLRAYLLKDYKCTDEWKNKKLYHPRIQKDTEVPRR